MIRWKPIIAAAEAIVLGYAYLITLRQLHYRLVMTPGLGYLNSERCYKRLSHLTAKARRDGTFPELLDQTREIVKPASWTSPASFLDPRAYFRDHTEGQKELVILGGEKATLLAQLQNWYGDLHIPIVLLRGYGSQSYVDEVRDFIFEDGRTPQMAYAGDFDPSGEDILRDFVQRCPRLHGMVDHVAVLEHQIASYGLPVNPGKAKDSRAKKFVDAHGRLVQVEVEALDPNDLKALYDAFLAGHWDETAYQASLAQEKKDRALLSAVKGAMDDNRLVLVRNKLVLKGA